MFFFYINSIMYLHLADELFEVTAGHLPGDDLAHALSDGTHLKWLK